MKYRLILILLCALIIGAQTAESQEGPPDHIRFKPNEVICKLLPGFSIDSINAEFGTSVKSHQQSTDCYLLNIPAGGDAESLAVQIAQMEGVLFCNPNFLLSVPEGLQSSSPFLDQNFSSDIATQLSATTLSLTAAQTISTGDGVRIALLDVGVDFEHPEFDRTPGLVVPRWDFVDGDIDPTDIPGGAMSGHGTFIAGILKLVAPQADIMVYRVLDSSGMGDGYSIADAVLQAVTDSCRIISLSLGMVGFHDALDEALKLAHQNNVLVVTSAGNDSTDLGSIFPFPAERTYCLAIAAVDSAGLKADFSNYGTKVDLCAPGTMVYGPYPDSIYAWWNGTSFAVPFVAGVAALVLEEHPEYTIDQLDTALMASARNIDSLNPEYVGLLGSGLLDPLAALNFLRVAVLGDLSGDGLSDLSDLSIMVAFLTGYVETPATATADLDCSGRVDLTDLSIIIAHVTMGQPLSCP
ncbi:MAG: S8 family serine peptidase [bacterium]|nr:S8 family serine peptidase [bacterium]